MQLTFRPYRGSSYSLTAVLVRGELVNDWLVAMEQMQVKPEECRIYALPGKIPKSLWGCLIAFDLLPTNLNIGKYQGCQNVQNRIFIPDNSEIYPYLNKEELQRMFSDGPYFFHPETGLVQLESAVSFEELTEVSLCTDIEVTKPAKGVSVPLSFTRLETHRAEPEDIIAELEKEHFPEKKEFSEQPLSLKEKILLPLLRFAFKEPPQRNIGGRESGGLISTLISLGLLPVAIAGAIFGKWMEPVRNYYESLEKRNQNDVQKLLDLFKTNPDEALKYAIPVDSEGVSRGKEVYGFQMQKLWSSFLLDNVMRGIGGSRSTRVLIGDGFNELNNQYRKTAEDLIKKGDYKKAAFIYLKLLKYPHLAAETLEQGKLYAEAASVYLQHSLNKKKAAECYEKANMLTKAIELNKDIQEYEIVGDLYRKMARDNDADKYYRIVIDEHIKSHKYVKASLVYRKKMQDNISAQSLLLDGWRKDRDAYNCLNNYFANIEDVNKLSSEINHIYQSETNLGNQEAFLEVLKHEHSKDESLRAGTKEIAYEIVASLAQKNISLVSELRHFNKDNNLVKDIIRFKHSKRKE